jgi:hypothetical protein
VSPLDSVDRLVAIEEIRRLKAQYWRFVDTKRWDDFGRLFAPDAHFLDHHAKFGAQGAEAIQAKISAALHPTFSVHMGHQSEIDIDDDQHARGIWTLEDYLIFAPGEVTPENPYAGTTLRGWGHYVEAYVKLDGAWRFQTIDLYRLRVEVTSPQATPYPPVTA